MKWLLGCGTLCALALILFVVPAGLEGPVLVPISPGHGLSLVDVVALVPLLAGTGLLLGGLWQRRQGSPHSAPGVRTGSRFRPGRKIRLRVPPGEVVPIGTPLAAELGGGWVHGGPGPRHRS